MHWESSEGWQPSHLQREVITFSRLCVLQNSFILIHVLTSTRRGDHTFSMWPPDFFFVFSKYFFLFKEMWSYFLNAVSFKFCLIFKERWSYFIHCVHCVHCIYCAHFGQTYLIWVKPHSFVQQQNENLESQKSFSAIFFLCLESFIFFFFIIAATFFRGIERTRAYLLKNIDESASY